MFLVNKDGPVQAKLWIIVKSIVTFQITDKLINCSALSSGERHRRQFNITGSLQGNPWVPGRFPSYNNAVMRKTCPYNDVVMGPQSQWRLGNPGVTLICEWGFYWGNHSLIKVMADSRFAPSQWETALLCNDVSHWMDASLKSAL